MIVIYRSDVARFGQPFFWPPACFPTPWPNTTSISSLISQLDQGIFTRSPRRGFVSQFLLTPTTWFVCKNLFGRFDSFICMHIDKVSIFFYLLGQVLLFNTFANFVIVNLNY